MKKVILYIATSLDGYIADKNQGVAWLTGDGSDEHNQGTYANFFDTIDTIILGYSTYQQIIIELSPDTWVYSSKKTYVLTHKNIIDKEDVIFNEDVIFTNEDINSLINKLKSIDGKNIWICGGASVVNQLHRMKLIDEYAISIIPIILGDGIRLFNKSEFKTKLRLKSTTNYNGIVDLVYEKY